MPLCKCSVWKNLNKNGLWSKRWDFLELHYFVRFYSTVRMVSWGNFTLWMHLVHTEYNYVQVSEFHSKRILSIEPDPLVIRSWSDAHLKLIRCVLISIISFLLGSNLSLFYSEWYCCVNWWHIFSSEENIYIPKPSSSKKTMNIFIWRTVVTNSEKKLQFREAKTLI